MAASLSGGICSLFTVAHVFPRWTVFDLVHRGSRFFIICLALEGIWVWEPQVPQPSSLLPPFLVSSVPALLSQELPPWACPPVSPVQILCGSPLSSSWGGAPRLCCSVDFTTDEGERTGKLSPDWDSVGTSQPAGYRAWLWVLWHVGLALHPLRCPWTPWRWTWLQPEVKDREVFFFFFNSFWRTVGPLHDRSYNNTITHIYIMCVYIYLLVNQSFTLNHDLLK